MPEIQAFRGIRYNLGQVGALGDVIAPPYDVIGPALQDQLYQQHPCNVVRLILNRIEPGDDDEANNRYTRAGKLLKNWREQGVLFTEADPAIYVYHQEFTVEGTTHVRRGFMARMRLSRFGEGLVFPHEETMSGPKADRLMLTVVTKANLSPVFGLYPDPAGEAQAILERAVADQTPLVARDHLGVVHRLWPVTDVSVISAVSGAMGPKPIFIADGHHRYETACNYRDQVYDSGFLSPSHPANYVLMMCIAMEDPGLIIMPTHRLFSDKPPATGFEDKPAGGEASAPAASPAGTLDFTAEELAAKISPCFASQPAGEGPAHAAALWEDIETEGSQGTLALFTRRDQRWLVARLTDIGRRRMADVAKEHSPDWQSLGVALLHRLLIGDLLGAKQLPKPGYLHLVSEVSEGLAGGAYPLAAMVMPATVKHVREISLHGERMPAKSTYFYPKLLSGLVINPLE